MNEMTRWSAAELRPPMHRMSVRSGVAGVVGALVMVLAIVVAGVIAVVFAATLAMVMALATALLSLTVIAWKARPRPQRALAVRQAGHAWVAYGWNRTIR